jgi:hypothetical protein
MAVVDKQKDKDRVYDGDDDEDDDDDGVVMGVVMEVVMEGCLHHLVISEDPIPLLVGSGVIIGTSKDNYPYLQMIEPSKEARFSFSEKVSGIFSGHIVSVNQGGLLIVCEKCSSKHKASS